MSKNRYLTYIGNRIKNYRKTQKFTLAGFSNMTGISAKHLGELENGKTNPSFEVLESVAKNLGVEVQDLIDSAEYKERQDKIDYLTKIIETSDENKLNKLYKMAKVLMD